MITLIPMIAETDEQGLGETIGGLLGWQFEPALADLPLQHALAYLDTGQYMPELQATDESGTPLFESDGTTPIMVAWDPYLLVMAGGIVRLLRSHGFDKGKSLAAIRRAQSVLADPSSVNTP